MSRPRTKGPTIGIRLPLTVDRDVRERAGKAGKSPGEYLADRVVASVQPKPTSNVRSIGVPPQPTACGHDRVQKFPTGMWRCEDCGAASMDRGASWRGA